MNYNLKILDKFKEVFNIILIFLTSFIFNIYYGSIGVFPIDTFAFFDSANLINKGFLPIRDYWTSNGFFVDILQSFFFKIFGVNWYSYLFHSSLINFIFAALTYKFLKRGLQQLHYFIVYLLQFYFIHLLECHFQIITLLYFH